MKLYTCGQAKSGGNLPFPLRHPCGAAARALDETGQTYELVKVAGYRMLPWTRRGDERAEIRDLSGQENVPVLQLDDGEVIYGSGKIIAWAKAHPAA